MKKSLKEPSIDALVQGLMIVNQNARDAANGVMMIAQQIKKEHERTNDITRATFETMSRRERPVFVKALRDKNYTQQEIGDMIGKSQSTVCQYLNSCKDKNKE